MKRKWYYVVNTNGERKIYNIEAKNLYNVLNKKDTYTMIEFENKLKEDYEVKQFAEGNYIVISYVSNGVTFGEAGTGMTGKVSMLSNTTAEEAKNEILKELRECDSGTEQGNLKMNALLKEKLELDKQVQTL